ncbi:hypothetical protein CYMTET_10986 [Cymbomonas tetramitiformis]|uniref:Uncharacterized protein n=1 Tax=Cymbomonas tetramitiformis TaxID=36881 RepID=A0AAE0GPK0_9CHLO|nr:hypothetical protein CYMTET_10986 [Cymbomonas tetramitiformis]
MPAPRKGVAWGRGDRKGRTVAETVHGWPSTLRDIRSVPRQNIQNSKTVDDGTFDHVLISDPGEESYAHEGGPAKALNVNGHRRVRNMEDSLLRQLSTGVCELNLKYVSPDEVLVLAEAIERTPDLQQLRLQVHERVYSSPEQARIHKKQRGKRQHEAIMEVSETLQSNRICKPFSRALGAMLQGSRFLTELELGATPGALGLTYIARGIATTHSLRQLSFGGSKMGDACFALLVDALAVNRSITKLTLYGCDLTDASALGLSKVIKAHAARRTVEGWQDTLRLYAADGSSIAPSAALVRPIQDDPVSLIGGYEELDLSYNLFTDATVKVLCGAVRMDFRMQVLGLSGNRLTTASATAWQGIMAEHSTLRIVDLRSNKAMDPSMQIVRSSRPLQAPTSTRGKAQIQHAASEVHVPSSVRQPGILAEQHTEEKENIGPNMNDENINDEQSGLATIVPPALSATGDGLHDDESHPLQGSVCVRASSSRMSLDRSSGGASLASIQRADRDDRAVIENLRDAWQREAEAHAAAKQAMQALSRENRLLMRGQQGVRYTKKTTSQRRKGAKMKAGPRRGRRWREQGEDALTKAQELMRRAVSPLNTPRGRYSEHDAAMRSSQSPLQSVRTSRDNVLSGSVSGLASSHDKAASERGSSKDGGDTALVGSLVASLGQLESVLDSLTSVAEKNHQRPKALQTSRPREPVLEEDGRGKVARDVADQLLNIFELG